MSLAPWYFFNPLYNPLGVYPLMAWNTGYGGWGGSWRGSRRRGRRHGRRGGGGKGRRGGRGGGRRRKYAYEHDDDEGSEEDDDYYDDDERYASIGQARESSVEYDSEDPEEGNYDFCGTEQDIGQEDDLEYFEHDIPVMEGYERISADEYFDGMAKAAKDMDLDTLKHVRKVAYNAHGVAIKQGNGSIAAGFNALINHVDVVISADHGVSHVGDLHEEDLHSEIALSHEERVDGEKFIEAPDSFLASLESSVTIQDLTKSFKVAGKKWKRYVMPRYSADSRIPKEYDMRRVVAFHDHLTYYFAIATYMASFAKNGMLHTNKGREQVDAFANVLAIGMNGALKNQLKEWKCSIKFLVLRGMTNRSDDYETSMRNREALAATKKNIESFTNEFTKLMLIHIDLEKDYIVLSGKLATGRAQYTDGMTQLAKKFSQSNANISAFWSRLVLFSYSQRSLDITGGVGREIYNDVKRSWEQHVSTTIGFIAALEQYGFSKNPWALKSDVEKMYKSGIDFGTLMNNYMYAMGGEAVPVRVVREMTAIAFT